MNAKKSSLLEQELLVMKKRNLMRAPLNSILMQPNFKFVLKLRLIPQNKNLIDIPDGESILRDSNLYSKELLIANEQLAKLQFKFSPVIAPGSC